MGTDTSLKEMANNFKQLRIINYYSLGTLGEVICTLRARKFLNINS